MAPVVATRVGPTSAPRVMLLLHGIYGWGRNWQSVAQRLVAARSDMAALLVDLPHHGDAGPGERGDTVRGVAADVAAWVDAERLPVTEVLGHSFGGKVALALAGLWPDRRLTIWVVDSTPDVAEPRGSAWDLLQLVRALPTSFPSRQVFVDALTSRGWSAGLAQWMATNLEREGDVFKWRLDFDAMERLLGDFVTANLWDVVERRTPGHVFHFIKATESRVLSNAALARLERLQSPGVHVHHLAGGHWIHAESPEAVVRLVLAAAPEPV